MYKLRYTRPPPPFPTLPPFLPRRFPHPLLAFFPSLFLFTFLLLHAQAPSRRMCCSPFLPCLFLGLMWLLDWTIQSSIYIPSSDPAQHASFHCAHWSRSLPMVFAAFDSGNPVTNRDSHVLALGFFAL